MKIITLANQNGGTEIQSYVKVHRHFDFKDGLRYSVTIPNCGYCYRKLKDALLRALEHESIGMSKYNSLKEIIDNKKLWNKIC